MGFSFLSSRTMKKYATTTTSVCLLFVMTVISCSTSKEPQGNFTTLPHPQEFSISGISKISPADLNTETFKENPFIDFIVDDHLDLPDEGYFLDIDKKRIHIQAKDQAGLFYAFASLTQLHQDAAEQEINLPICHIKDFPALSYRAIHLDIKHHREKLEYYYELMDWLASYKINAIIAEVEDKIKYERRPEIGSPDAFTIEEWQKLSDYALERNIEISPLVQGLGHASFILKHDQYKNLRDDPESDWAFNPLDPGTYELQFDLYLDAMAATPHGRYLHVGGDEVHTTGRGSGQSNLELQLYWLNKVCAFAESHDRIPIFWDDMPLKFAGVYQPMFNATITEAAVDQIWADNEHKLLAKLDQFPKNCIYMRWNYQMPQTYGNNKAMEWFRAHDLEVMGATAGQTRWVLMPQNESNIDNIRSFALSSADKGLSGLLLTLWDDDSPHFELYKRGIVAFAEYTWAGDKRSKQEIKSAYRQREFSQSLASDEYAFIDQLEQPVAFWKNALLKGNKRNALPKAKNPLEESVIDLPDKNHPGAFAAQHADRLAMALSHLETCQQVAKAIGTMQSKAIRNQYSLKVYEQVNQLTQFSLQALLLLQEYDLAENETSRLEVQEKLSALPNEFTQLRTELEGVYGLSRILNKPDHYLLDQDHHQHLANQSVTFDWQFLAEMKFLEKLERYLID